MAMKIYCDMCGKEIEDGKNVTVIINPHDGYPYESLDYCQECTWDVRRSLVVLAEKRKENDRAAQHR